MSQATSGASGGKKRKKSEAVNNDNEGPAKKSKHTGVFWNRKIQKWEARPYINGKKLYAGQFTLEEEAAKFVQQSKAKGELVKPQSIKDLPQSKCALSMVRATCLRTPLSFSSSSSSSSSSRDHALLPFRYVPGRTAVI